MDQIQMMEKLQVKNIPRMEFISSFGHVILFQDLYDFIKIMGYGGFGIVVAALEKSSGKKMALKIVDKSANVQHVRALEQEAEILKTLLADGHKNIIEFYYLQNYNNYLLMSMKLSKESLQDFHTRWNESGKPLTEDECSKIMKGILQGLTYLHDQKKIIHRDLKPGNVLIGSYKDLTDTKLIDFGLAVENKKKAI